MAPNATRSRGILQFLQEISLIITTNACEVPSNFTGAVTTISTSKYLLGDGLSRKFIPGLLILLRNVIFKI